MNFLEQLLAEWYQYKGYYVRQNIRIGKRTQGGYAGEIDILAYDPKTKIIIHIEASSDTYSWETRKEKFERKFRVAKEEIPFLFQDFEYKEIQQKAIFLFGAKSREEIGGGKLYLASDIMQEIYNDLKDKSILKEIVPENFMLLRTIQVFVSSMKKMNL